MRISANRAVDLLHYGEPTFCITNEMLNRTASTRSPQAAVSLARPLPARHGRLPRPTLPRTGERRTSRRTRHQRPSYPQPLPPQEAAISALHRLDLATPLLSHQIGLIYT